MTLAGGFPLRTLHEAIFVNFKEFSRTVPSDSAGNFIPRISGLIRIEMEIFFSGSFENGSKFPQKSENKKNKNKEIQ